MKVKNVMTTAALTGLLTTMIPATISVAEEGTEPKEIRTVSLDEYPFTDVREEKLFLGDGVQNSENLLLVPGSFYYFVKQAMDTLQLKLATSNQGKAILLTQLATEKIEMAFILIQEEKFDEADIIMDEGFAFLESIMEYSEEQEIEEIESNEDTTDPEITVDIDINTDQPNEEKADEDSDETILEDSYESIPGYQAVISLLHNIDKVENPKAKAALKRNVIRKLTKLGIDPETVIESNGEEFEEIKEDEDVTEKGLVEESSNSEAVITKDNGQDSLPGLQRKASNSNKINGSMQKKGNETKASKGNNNRNENNRNGDNGKSNSNGKGKGNGKR